MLGKAYTSQEIVDKAEERLRLYENVSDKALASSGITLPKTGRIFPSERIRKVEPETDKKFETLWAFANTGCQATLQIAIGDSFSKDKKNWISIGDLTEGYKESRFPSDTRGKLLFWKLSETSTNARFHFYGFSCDYDNEIRR